jgi:hypothetical protein
MRGRKGEIGLPFLGGGKSHKKQAWLLQVSISRLTDHQRMADNGREIEPEENGRGGEKETEAARRRKGRNGSPNLGLSCLIDFQLGANFVCSSKGVNQWLQKPKGSEENGKKSQEPIPD